MSVSAQVKNQAWGLDKDETEFENRPNPRTLKTILCG